MDKDTPHCKLVLFHPDLKAYPTYHSWIITAHISLGNVEQQTTHVQMTENPGSSTVVRLKDQLLASQLNALMD